MTKGAYIGPFQRIVNVGWGGNFVAFQFRSRLVTGVQTTGGVFVFLPQLGFFIVPTAGFTKSPSVVSAAPAFHQETTTSFGGGTTTTTNYNYNVSFSSGLESGTGSGTITVVSDGTNSFWSSNGGAGGAGDIGSAEAYFLSHGWDTFSATETGSSSHSDSGHTLYNETDNGILIFSLGALKKLINDPLVTELQLTFSTGDPPLAVEGGPPTSYDWTSIIGSYRGATFFSFPVDAQVLPLNWKASVAERTDIGNDNQSFDFRIDFKTLAIRRA